MYEQSFPFAGAVRELFWQTVPKNRSRFPSRAQRPLAMERLEDRRVLSVFYELDVVADAGTRIQGAETITHVRPEVSINDHCTVAFVGGLNSLGETVLVARTGQAPKWIGEATLSPVVNYLFPQINSAGKVVATSQQDSDLDPATAPDASSVQV